MCFLVTSSVPRFTTCSNHLLMEGPGDEFVRFTLSQSPESAESVCRERHGR